MMRRYWWTVFLAIWLLPGAAHAERWVVVGTPESEEDFAWQIDADSIARDGSRRTFFIRIKDSSNHQQRTVDCDKRLLILPSSTMPIDDTNEINRAAFNLVCRSSRN